MDAQDEVRRLHRVLAKWLRGELPQTLAAYATFKDALEADFEMISPRAVIDTKQSLVAEIWKIHGAWQDKPYDIEIREMTTRWQTTEYCLVRYEEWHVGKTPPEVRLSSALFRNVENSWRWFHIHETWLPDMN